MIHLSSYHSNGLPTVVWSNKVNLIGEKVYKPKIHFCEHCNKPILIYGRLIPCKHVFCFSCATLCLTQHQQTSYKPTLGLSPPQPMSNDRHHNTNSPIEQPIPPSQNYPYHKSPSINHLSPLNNNNSNHSNNNSRNITHDTQHSSRHRRRTPTRNSSSNIKNLDLYRSDSNQSFSSRDNNNCASLINIDESTSNTTPTTIQQDITMDSPNLNGTNGSGQAVGNISKGCHRCGGRALRVERNNLNSIFVCQIENCRRTYLSARDLQAHVNHRHSKNKSNNHSGTTSASLAAISSSPYISSSSLLHLNNNSSGSGNQNNRQSASSSTNHPGNHINSPNYNHQHHNRQDRDYHSRRDRDRFREREGYQRDRERERDNKEYHRQSIQRAAQWAEASAQMMEKGLTR